MRWIPVAAVALAVACSNAAPAVVTDASVSPSADGAVGRDGASEASVDAGADAAPACTGSSAQPAPRGDAVGGVDPATGSLYVFGGDDGPTQDCMPAPSFREDTWRYEPGCDRWTEVTGDGHPSPRSRAASAVDTRRHRMLVFGGRYRHGPSGAYTLYRDVWAFDLAGARWEMLATTGPGPSARANATAVYDAAGDALVVYGGNTSTSGLTFAPQGDAWALDLGTLAWRRVSSGAGGPMPRLFHAAAVRDRTMVVVGGGGADAFTGPFYQDAWQLDLAAGTWTAMSLTGDTDVLGGRINAGLVPDPTGNGFVLSAGHDDGSLGNRNDVLSLGPDGAVHALRPGDALQHPGTGFCSFPADFVTTDAMAPERRSAFVLALDAPRRRAILYGGKTDCGLAGDVWALDLAAGSWQVLRGTPDGLSCARTGRTTCSSLCQ